MRYRHFRAVRCGVTIDSASPHGRRQDMGKPVVHFEVVGRDGPGLQKFYADLFVPEAADAIEAAGTFIADHAAGAGPGRDAKSAS
jgi:hypothetical protein